MEARSSQTQSLHRQPLSLGGPQGCAGSGQPYLTCTIIFISSPILWAPCLSAWKHSGACFTWSDEWNSFFRLGTEKECIRLASVDLSWCPPEGIPPFYSPTVTLNNTKDLP